MTNVEAAATEGLEPQATALFTAACVAPTLVLAGRIAGYLWWLEFLGSEQIACICGAVLLLSGGFLVGGVAAILSGLGRFRTRIIPRWLRCWLGAAAVLTMLALVSFPTGVRSAAGVVWREMLLRPRVEQLRASWNSAGDKARVDVREFLSGAGLADVPQASWKGEAVLLATEHAGALGHERALLVGLDPDVPVLSAEDWSVVRELIPGVYELEGR